MPCCEWVLSVAASSSSRTPSWLHRLHAKGGLSIPSHLNNIDDLLYGQSRPPPPPPSPLAIVPPPPSASVDHHDTNPPPNPKPPCNPSRPNPSGGSNNNPPQPQLQPHPHLSGVISDLFAVPSAPRSSRTLKPFRKQHRSRLRSNNKSPLPHKDAKGKAKAKKRRRADRATDADGKRSSRTEVTVIDTSNDGWKAAKVLVRTGTVWKIRDKKDSGISKADDLSKGRRRAGLVAKIQRDKEKGKDVVLLGDVHASRRDAMKESDDGIRMLKRPRYSNPEGQNTGILLLQNTSTLSHPWRRLQRETNPGIS